MFSKNFSKMRTIDESKLIYAYIEQGMQLALHPLLLKRIWCLIC